MHMLDNNLPLKYFFSNAEKPDSVKKLSMKHPELRSNQIRLYNDS